MAANCPNFLDNMQCSFVDMYSFRIFSVFPDSSAAAMDEFHCCLYLYSVIHIGWDPSCHLSFCPVRLLDGEVGHHAPASIFHPLKWQAPLRYKSFVLNLTKCWEAAFCTYRYALLFVMVGKRQGEQRN